MSEEIYIKFKLNGGLVDGLEEYLPINVREVRGFILPPRPDDDYFKGWDEETPCAMTVEDFLNCLSGQSPDYPVGRYRQCKGYPGDLVYIGPDCVI